MKYVKSAPLFLSMALLTGCGQSASDMLSGVFGSATTKVSNLFSGAPDPELVKLKQQLAQAQKQLADSNTALASANAKLKSNSILARSLQKEYALLKQEGAAIADTTRHVRVLKQRLSNQTSQLNQLAQTLQKTEASCLAIAKEVAGESSPIVKRLAAQSAVSINVNNRLPVARANANKALSATRLNANKALATARANANKSVSAAKANKPVSTTH